MVRSLLSKAGLRENEEAILPGAQTERRGDAGLVGVVLGGLNVPLRGVAVAVH
jgi:hypothetical protein